MVHLRRFGATVLATMVLAALAVSPASAQTETRTVTAPEAFVASTSGRALGIDLLGTSISLGTSAALIEAILGQSASAEAQGAGALLVSGTIANASVDALDGADDPPKACVVDLPLAGLLTAALACGDAAASVSGGLPTATASGNVTTIDLGLTLLQPLLDQLLELADQLIGDVIGTLEGLLGGLLNPLLGTLGLDPLSDLVSELIDGIQRATSVLTIEVGTSESVATTGADAVTAGTVAEGATINVLPGLVLGSGAPLLSIIVGSAEASVSVTRPDQAENNPAKAVATPAFDPAIARVILGLPILGAGILEVPVALGTPLTLLAGTPLESTIALGAGTSTVDPDTGVATAVADGVSIRLLKGLSGGIGVELAHAEAVAGGQSGVFKITQAPPLADTGAEPWLPLAGAGMLLAAFSGRRMLATTRLPR